MAVRAQGATQLASSPTYRPIRAAAPTFRSGEKWTTRTAVRAGRVDHLPDLRCSASGALGKAPPSRSVLRKIGPQLGQGATEYLVLLAVVLIVALVSVALLGFFPGMASDAQYAQAQTYWQAASPIAILEGDAANYNNLGRGTNFTLTYLRIRNNCPDKITITKIIAGNDSTALVWVGGWDPTGQMRDYFVLSPGEETYFGSYSYWPGLPSQRKFFGFPRTNYPSSATGPVLNGVAQSQCEASPPYGQLIVKNFGFEYEVEVNGQRVTKRQVGPLLIVKCTKTY